MSGSASKYTPSPMVSVLIVNWNTRPFLTTCLGSIQVHLKGIEHEVIVVDNNSPDGSAEAVSCEFSWVRLFANKSNDGYAAANNQALSAAKGEYLLTLNPDTEFIDDSLKIAIDYLEANPEVAIIGARQVTPSGETQRSVRGFPTLVGIFGDLAKLGKLFPNTAFDSYRLTGFNYENLQEAPQPMGTFLLMKRSAIEACGPIGQAFDEQFPIFFNEVDLLKRLRDHGFQCVYHPDVKILHHGGESTKQRRKEMIWESHRSLSRYLDKHTVGGTRIMLPAVKGAIWLGALIRAKGVSDGFRPQRHDL